MSHKDAMSRKETVSLFLLTVFHSLKKYIKGKGKGENKSKGKAIPISAWQELNVPESEGLQVPSQSAHENVQVVSSTHRPPLALGNIPGNHFC
jgi:hypothetical protein